MTSTTPTLSLDPASSPLLSSAAEPTQQSFDAAARAAARTADLETRFAADRAADRAEITALRARNAKIEARNAKVEARNAAWYTAVSFLGDPLGGLMRKLKARAGGHEERNAFQLAHKATQGIAKKIL
ncbi:hypothetical protein HKX48_007267 [Thoreauomyces humboldtii]|nr:hypothetical protein HKX48_007267 [Thoreauomyces humboldtii]